MAGTYIGKYDTTAGNNSATGTSSVSVAEGMLPSNINNAFRDVMADIRQWYNDSQWIEYGDSAGVYTPAYASSTSLTIAGINVTAIYHAKRRIKVIASTPGTIYGTITSTSFSTNTTVNISWDSGSLSDEAITSVYIGVLTNTNDSIPTGINAAKIGGGDVSTTEFDYLNGVSSALQTQLDAKQATITGSATTIDTESLTASRALISNGSQKVAVSAVTDTELGYLDGVTSAIQTQLAAKAATTYVDNAIAGMRTRIVCEAASTGNLSLSSDLQNGDTVDGVTLATGDEVLLKNQSTDSQNGIYTVVSSGTASRSTEYDSIDEISGQMVVINQGTANDNTIWLCTTNSSATLGSDSISFTKITPQNIGDVTLTGTQTLTNKTLTAPKINEDVAVTSTATELNLLDGKSAANFALTAKTEGTNFTDSLLVGHATTGTLNSATDNTGVGIDAMTALTSGKNNTAVGQDAGKIINSGIKNTYIGSNAGIATTTGDQNTGVGMDALKANVGSNSTTAVGYAALIKSTGANNTALGDSAGAEIVGGASNITIGKAAGDNITSGDGNVIIGSLNAGSATGDKQLLIADGVDGSVNWISGDSSGNIIIQGTTIAAGGQLSTTGKSLVMGF